MSARPLYEGAVTAYLSGWLCSEKHPDGPGSYGARPFTTRLAGPNFTEIARAGDSIIEIV